MSSNNSQHTNPSKKPLPASGARKPSFAPKVEVAIKPEYPSWLNWAIVGGILAVTFFCYHYTLHNQFTNWDDGLYIYDNPYIKNLSPANLNMLLFHDAAHNYYHPITMMSIALNYHFAGLNPFTYYLTEIVMHLINTALVFFVSFALLSAMAKRGYGKIKGIPFWAGLCCLWHGIHPMHVESVSWVAERKDVLYLFFYLIGLLTYISYLMKGKKSKLIWVGVLFIASMLSKPLAVVFPLSLLVIDILLKRDKNVNLRKEGFLPVLFGKTWENLTANMAGFWVVVINKIPFLIISLLFGIKAYQLQVESGCISALSTFTIVQRFTFVGENYLMYLFKFFVPTHLCSFYPYPELSDGGYMPLFFYFSPFVALGITGGLLWLAYKGGGENYFRVVLFGFAYYFFNVMYILQFVSSGPAIMSERYTYASYFGFVFMLVYFIYQLTEKLPAAKYPVYILLTAFSIMLGYLCEARTYVWHSTKTLWEDVISKFPAKADTIYNSNHSQFVVHVHSGVETAYKNLGNYYVEDINPPNYDSAFLYFEVLEKINSKDVGVYSNIGNIWAIRGDYKKSLAAYTHALKIDSTSKSSFDIFLNRGITYSREGQYDQAIRDFDRADKMNPYCQKLYENRGYVYIYGLKQYDSAIADYNRLISIDPNVADYYLKKGIAEFNKNDYKDAITDFRKDVSLDSKSLNGLFNLSLAYKFTKDYAQAIIYAKKAIARGYKLPDKYVEELQALAK